MTVSADLRRVADGLDRRIHEALERTALEAKNTFLDAGRRASGGDLRLSGVGRRGVRINVRYDFDNAQAVTIRAVGPWQFIESPRRGGYQIPKKPGRKRKRRVVAFNGDVVTGPIRGGSAGAKRAWTKALPDVADNAQEIFDRELAEALRW